MGGAGWDHGCCYALLPLGKPLQPHGRCCPQCRRPRVGTAVLEHPSDEQQTQDHEGPGSLVEDVVTAGVAGDDLHHRRRADDDRPGGPGHGGHHRRRGG